MPLVSRLLAAVELVFSSAGEVRKAFPDLQTVRKPPGNPKAQEHYRRTYFDAMQARRDGIAEARKVAAEISLLYPGVASEAAGLLVGANIEGVSPRSETEETGYQTARKALMDHVTALANKGR